MHTQDAKCSLEEVKMSASTPSVVSQSVKARATPRVRTRVRSNALSAWLRPHSIRRHNAADTAVCTGVEGRRTVRQVLRTCAALRTSCKAHSHYPW